MPLYKIALLIAILTAILNICYCLYCLDYKNAKQKHQYYTLRQCKRSNKSVNGLANFRRVQRCADFARSRHALAFNFAPIARGSINRFDNQEINSTGISGYESHVNDEFFNCESLSCPESIGFPDLLNDTRYNYYSLYNNPPPPVNATCIKSLGVFMYFNQFSNYSDATRICKTKIKSGGGGGGLALIMSELRTNALSNFIRHQRNDSRLGIAYVGLNQTNNNIRSFVTAEMVPITCYTYRAWAPGHPYQGRHPGCITVTTENSWKMFSCNKQLPFICEIYPTKPKRKHYTHRKHKCSIE